MLNNVPAQMSHHKRGGKVAERYSMADVESILAQLQEEAAVRGASWLQDTLGTVLQGREPLSGTRGWRSSPPEQFSTDRHAGPQQRAGGSDAGTLAGPAAKWAAVLARGSLVRCPEQQGDL